MSFRTMLLALVLVCLGLNTGARAQSYTITWSTIDAGGHTDSVAGLFTLSGTFAQHDAGSSASPLTGGQFSLLSGFWAIVSPRCASDFNADGFVNSQDFFDFVSAFFALSPNADFNRNGFINSQDYFDFLSAFFSGCA